MSEPCALGRKTCQWPWGRRFCAPHIEVWLEGLRIARRIRRPVQLLDGRWVEVVTAAPALELVR